MIDLKEIHEALNPYFSEIHVVKEKVFRCAREYEGNPYQYVYFDFSGALPKENVSEYCNELMSEDYFGQADYMQWNYYLAFIVQSEPEREIVAEIERNEDFAKKYVVAASYFSEWLSQHFMVTKTNVPVIEFDLAAKWRQLLVQNNLDCICDQKIPFTKGLTGIISGIYEKSEEGENLRNYDSSNVPEVDGIGTIFLDEYREGLKVPYPTTFERINLIAGPNGQGKTSLLEAIEYVITGDNQRALSTDSSTFFVSPYRIRAKTLSGLDLDSGTLDIYSKMARDAHWYGAGGDRRKSRLAQHFGRFNFFDTDASANFSRESKKGKEQRDIVEELENLALGPEVSAIESNIKKYTSDLKSARKSKSGESDKLRKDIKLSEEQLDKLRVIGGPSSELIQEIRNSLSEINWKNSPTLSKDELANFEKLNIDLLKAANKLTEILNSLSFIERPKLSKLASTKIVLEGVVRKLDEKLTLLAENNAEQTKLVLDLDKKKTALVLYRQLLPYYELNVHTEVTSIEANLLKLKSKIDSLNLFQSNYLLIPPSAVSALEGQFMAELRRIEVQLSEVKAELAESDSALANLKKSVSDLQNLRAELIRLGTILAESSQTQSDCPLCLNKFSSKEELLSQIRKQTSTFPDSEALSSAMDKHSHLSEQYKNLVALRAFVISLETAYSSISDSVVGDIDAELISDALMKVKAESERLDEYEAKLLELTDIKQSIDENELDGIQFSQIEESLNQSGNDAKFRDMIGILNHIDSVSSDVRKCEADLEELRKASAGINTSMSKVLKDYDERLDVAKSGSNQNLVREIKMRSDIVDRIISEASENRFPVQLDSEDDFAELKKELEYTIKLVTRAIREIKDERQSNANKEFALHTIRDSKAQLDTVSLQIDNIDKALGVLDQISIEYGKSAYLEDFFVNNKAAIREIFLAIHSPQEFVELDVINGALILTRKTGAKADLYSISTGQRSALALSLFLTQNSKLSNGPGVILLDDPMAFTDDLNILSFFDYLRQFIMLNPKKQLFFATANANIAFLFRKKFEVFGKSLKLFSLQNATQNTSGAEIH